MADTCGCTHHDTNVLAVSDVKPGRFTADQTVAEVAQRSPAALQAMKQLGLNHCCGAHLSLSEAAAAAGVGVREVLDAVNAALTSEAGPPPGFRRVEVDVRDDIAKGREPFAKIMSAVQGLAADEALVLRVPFEPVPLYGVLGKRGFSHWTEASGTDWTIWFFRTEAPRQIASPRLLDVRGMEPPAPLVAVMQMLDTLGPDDELIVVHDRRPVFLYPQLEDRGFTHQTAEPQPGLVRITIQKAKPAR